MDKSILIKKYFEEKKFVDSNIQSFNNFLEKGLQEVVEENKEAEPAIIPHNIEKFKIRFGRITVGKPEITEADGSARCGRRRIAAGIAYCHRRSGESHCCDDDLPLWGQ